MDRVAGELLDKELAEVCRAGGVRCVREYLLSRGGD
jgi:hypothetical protein